MLRVFVSATTVDLGSYRRAVRDVLLGKGVFPVLQDAFPPDYRTVHDVLRHTISGCDAVICLVGSAYGQEPRQRPDGAPRRSYTQLEYEIAAELGKPAYVFIAQDACAWDAPVSEDPDRQQLQRDHRARLQQRDHVWHPFSSVADLETQIAQIAFATAESATRTPNNLPYQSLGPLFRGRDAFITGLHAALAARPAASISATQVIHGLGGVGKTRLAVEYVWRYRADYTALLFVAADAPASLERNLAALAAPAVLTLPEHQANEEETRVAAVLRWLESHPGWCLILDNVDTEDAASAVERVLPRLRQGHVLITSRMADWGPGVESLELDVLAEDAAAGFLLERTRDRRRPTAQDDADAHALAHELGGLALAVEQAGAYIVHRRTALGDYLTRWRGQEVNARDWVDARVMKYPRSVAVTWETTEAQLGPHAGALLRLFAWLAPDPIPRFLLEGPDAAQVFARAVAGAGADPPAGTNAADPEDALAQLAAYSMVRWDTSGNIRIHRLVQELTRGRVEARAERFWIEQALRLVNAAAPDDPTPYDVRSWTVWEALRPHAAAVVARADQMRVLDPTGRLMFLLGVFLRAKCVFAAAEPLLTRALAIVEQVHGPAHPEVANVLNGLATLLYDTNRSADAESLFRRALAIREAASDSRPAEVAESLNNLGLLLYNLNRSAEAEPLLRRSLTMDEAALGPAHLDVAIRLNNLALLLQDTNRLAEAEPLYRRAVAIGEAALGPAHPMVGIYLNNLARLLYFTKRLDEAEALQRRALAIDEAAYGPNHPTVSVRLDNLGRLLHDTKRTEQAEPLLRRALTIDEATYGPMHPSVARALATLGRLLTDTKRPDEAEPLLRRALAINEQAYGPTHPTVAHVIASLARLSMNRGNLAEAESLARRSVTALRRSEATSGHPHRLLAGAIATYRSILAAQGLPPDEIERRIRDVPHRAP